MKSDNKISPIKLFHRFKEYFLPYMIRFAVETGLKSGYQDYTRFIILGRSRVGSNLLRGLLNSHPEISVFGELFQNPEIFDWALPGHRKTKKILRIRQDDPKKFIENYVFHRFPVNTRAVGFKIFYYHAQSENWKPVWDYLKQNKDIRVIHIKRENILKTHLSRKRAILSGAWVETNKKSQTRKVGPIHLDYENCLEDFKQTREWEHQFESFFKDHPSFEVIYEDLAADHQRTMTQIQEFLSVSPHQVEMQTYKQSRRNLSQAIDNYDELKARFKGTEWETFFVEDEA